MHNELQFVAIKFVTITQSEYEVPFEVRTEECVLLIKDTGRVRELEREKEETFNHSYLFNAFTQTIEIKNVNERAKNLLLMEY